MTDKKMKEALKLLIKKIEPGFGEKCKEEHWDCPGCKAYHLKAGLEWWLDLIEWEEK